MHSFPPHKNVCSLAKYPFSFWINFRCSCSFTCRNDATPGCLNSLETDYLFAGFWSKLYHVLVRFTRKKEKQKAIPIEELLPLYFLLEFIWRG